MTSNLKDQYKKNGYFVLRNLFDEKILENAYQEILKSNKVIKYYDKKKQIRRIEKIYNKGKNLRKINKLILIKLQKILNKEFTIFKDKLNTKPKGGEGFYPHYDGVFEFKDNKNNIWPGWYKYTSYFVNVLVAIDKCGKKNGSIEIAPIHKGGFKKLLNNTKKDGTPDLKKNINDKLKYKTMLLNAGDEVVFSNACPHKSKKNNSLRNRRTIYYTYSLKKNGSFYNLYFKDKKYSANKTSKSLSGEI